MRCATARAASRRGSSITMRLAARPRLVEQRERHDGALAGAGRRDEHGVAAALRAPRSAAGEPRRWAGRSASMARGCDAFSGRDLRGSRRASSSNARARLTTGTSMTQPSSDVEPRPRRSASSNAATIRSACATSCGRRREAFVQCVELLRMNREFAFEADALRVQWSSPQAVRIAQLEVRRVERQHVRRARRDAQSLARVGHLRLVREPLDPHVVREVFAAERDGDDAFAGAADRVAVHDSFGRLDPRQQLQLPHSQACALLVFRKRLRDCADVGRRAHLADRDAED